MSMYDLRASTKEIRAGVGKKKVGVVSSVFSVPPHLCGRICSRTSFQA